MADNVETSRPQNPTPRPTPMPSPFNKIEPETDMTSPAASDDAIALEATVAAVELLAEGYIAISPGGDTNAHHLTMLLPAIRKAHLQASSKVKPVK